MARRIKERKKQQRGEKPIKATRRREKRREVSKRRSANNQARDKDVAVFCVPSRTTASATFCASVK